MAMDFGEKILFLGKKKAVKYLQVSEIIPIFASQNNIK